MILESQHTRDVLFNLKKLHANFGPKLDVPASPTGAQGPSWKMRWKDCGDWHGEESIATLCPGYSRDLAILSITQLPLLPGVREKNWGRGIKVRRGRRKEWTRVGRGGQRVKAIRVPCTQVWECKRVTISSVTHKETVFHRETASPDLLPLSQTSNLHLCRKES